MNPFEEVNQKMEKAATFHALHTNSEFTWELVKVEDREEYDKSKKPFVEHLKVCAPCFNMWESGPMREEGTPFSKKNLSKARP